MRQSFSIVKATALEILSEPLSLLTLLAALAIAVLAPAFHYHQFGDPTRMARDAGFSALFTCGSVLAVFGTVRAFRREIESGTLEMALAHPVSRPAFFLAKTFGAFCAYLVFVLTVLGAAIVMFEGAAIGGVLAKQTGDIARIFGPCLAGGVAIAVFPLVLAALLNRFARFRFVLSSLMSALTLSVCGGGFLVFLSRGYVLRLVPVAVLLVLLSGMLLCAAAAFAVRFKANVAVTATGLVFALLVPAIGNYYLADALSGAGTVSWRYVGLALAAAVPVDLFFLLLGIRFIGERDVS